MVRWGSFLFVYLFNAIEFGRNHDGGDVVMVNQLISFVVVEFFRIDIQREMRQNLLVMGVLYELVEENSPPKVRFIEKSSTFFLTITT